jgi:hypothetical protein
MSGWMWALWADRPEHSRCGGWTIDIRDQVMTCACGAPLFRLGGIAGGAGGAAA